MLGVLVCKVYWCVDVLVCWCVDVLVCWCVGVLVCWCVGVLVCYCVKVVQIVNMMVFGLHRIYNFWNFCLRQGFFRAR